MTPDRQRQAVATHDLATALGRLPDQEADVAKLAARIRPFARLEHGSRVLDLGAAQGGFVIALNRQGYYGVGIEPALQAIEVGHELSKRLGTEIEVLPGVAESLPFDDESFDLVHAMSVMEHVQDPDAVFREAYRVLRPAGALYFYSTNALCPKQNEISRFPLFPWYPQSVKRRIVDWAMRERPWLVGYSATPAYNWYTPWGVRLALGNVGFRTVMDRWQIKRDEELDELGRLALRIARSTRAGRLLGDLLVPEASYLAIK